MNATRKSFILSLLFHSMMGALAFFMLTRMSIPPPMLKISIEKMTLVSLTNLPNSVKPHTLQTSSPQTLKAPQPQKPLPKNQTLATQTTPIKAPSSTKTVVAVSPVITSEISPRSAAITAPQSHITPAPSPIKAQSISDLTAEKKSFFASLRTTIQNHLHYPTAARRRAMEGDIAVRFSLANDGTIHFISIQRGETIFHNAAKTAVAAASGIDIPTNLTDSLPMEIELILEFKLNG
ncbi:MAG: energy transducer TonB [Sulfuricurvum sp.]|nr:energy transducer TonB [Sulfuricurvum sp.]